MHEIKDNDGMKRELGLSDAAVLAVGSMIGSVIFAGLLIYQPTFTWSGIIIVLFGISVYCFIAKKD